MTRLLTIVGIALILLLNQACNNLNENEWELTYKRKDDFTGKTLIKIGTKNCYYEAETGIENEVARIKWESSSEKLKALFKKIEVHQLQNGTPLEASEVAPPFETIRLVQNGKVVYSLQKEKQTKEMSSNFNEVAILILTFSMEQQGWKF